MRFLQTLILFLTFHVLIAQDTYDRNTGADVLSYEFHLTLNDENDIIDGTALIQIRLLAIEPFNLDLIAKSGDYGMEVINILEDSVQADYSFDGNKIRISPKEGSSRVRTYTVAYKGEPETGLIIDKTKFGQRSFFGDNWPNRARYWLPCVDHPYDKASVSFYITAPDHYDVVATGSKIEESSIDNGMKLTAYHEPAPVAMKVVTIGVTQFATRLLGTVNNIPVTAWVYPENRQEGFSDYAVAEQVMTYFINQIGPYSYAKLANMQAKTQWGGLENAGTIAYNENSVTGEGTVEGLIAHEIAHQWFGNSASENDWNHVWLSEGFATYFTILYLEHYYGNEKRKEELQKDRNEIISYYQKNPSPIVDPSIKDPMKVLSTNSYQKGGWTLNMLRHKLGDELFWKGIRTYYATYMNANAMTEDLKNVMESVSGQELDQFFEQWVFTKGYPELDVSWKYRSGKITGTVSQLQNHYTFKFPLELGITIGDKTEIMTVEVNAKNQSFEFPVSAKPMKVEIDPGVWLLFED